MNDITIGIDISKDTLDAYRLPDGIARQFANTATGHTALLKWIGAIPARVVYEPTGAYHRALEVRLSKAEMPIVKVNPRQARHFAEATGQLAKTDAIDAAMLARMGAWLHLDPRPVCDAITRQLKDLHLAREALIKDRTAARNRASVPMIPLLKRHAQERLQQIARQIKAIDKAIADLIARDPVLTERFDILCSVPGIAATTAAMLLSEMPELGSLDQGQAAALAGLAPVTRQSGKWKGTSSIRAGRRKVRQALYMPALVACRYNPDLKAKYAQLIANGKPAKKAITAIMRKLLLLANALLKANRNWTPKNA